MKAWMPVMAFALILGWLVVVGANSTSAQAPAPSPICDNSVLTGPATAPTGSVTVAAGDDSSVFDATLPAGLTFYFAPGVHTLGTGEYSQIKADTGDTFIGAPGAILSGQWDDNYAFTNGGSDVTIKYLTIENFDPGEGQGAVNQGGGANWTVEDDTIEFNAPGAGLMVGTGNVVEYDCLTENGEYGFDAYVAPSDPTASSLTGGPSNITLSHDEISYNDTCNWEAVSPDPVPATTIPAACKQARASVSCGCSGGGKFWRTDGASVTDNDVHDNYNVGIWADTDNTGFDVSGNVFVHNWSMGYQEEISYNFSISDNVFTDNAWGSGPTNPGFAEPALYISESGGDSRVPGAYSGTALISDNTFADNWSGVVLWQSANRFCSDGFDAPCTLIEPSVFTVTSCAANLPSAIQGQATGSPAADYWDGCLWKTQNVRVAGNIFSFSQADVPGCELSSNSCGENGMFSQYGTSAPYDRPSPYTIADAISNSQGNEFSGNTYLGPWSFVGLTQGKVVTAAQWTGGFADPSAAGNSFAAQDAGSTFSSTAPTSSSLPLTTATVSLSTTTSVVATTSKSSSTTTTTTNVSPTSTTTVTATTTTTTPEQSVNATFQFEVDEGGGTFSCATQHYAAGDTTFTAECTAVGSAGSGLTAPFKVSYGNGDYTWSCDPGPWPGSPGWWYADCTAS